MSMVNMNSVKDSVRIGQTFKSTNGKRTFRVVAKYQHWFLLQSMEHGYMEGVSYAELATENRLRRA